MLPWLDQGFGNPSSVHASGRRARNAIEDARETIARLLGVESSGLVFTSGGTEANHLAIAGFSGRGARITSNVEHAAVLEPVKAHGERGGVIHILEAGPSGQVTEAALAERLESDSLVSLMWVNNELGSINPVAKLSALAKTEGCTVHCDAVQGPAWTNLSLPDLAADLVTLSAHKIGGPKGVGLLYVAPGSSHGPVAVGGGQEQGRRGGTENVPAIVGFSKALELLYQDPERTERLASLGTRLRTGLEDRLAGEIEFNTPAIGAAPHILNVSVPGIPSGSGAEMLILGLDLEGVEVSAGSACASGALSAGHVAKAIGRDGVASIRFSLGFRTRPSEIDEAVEATALVIRRVRASL